MVVVVMVTGSSNRGDGDNNYSNGNNSGNSGNR